MNKTISTLVRGLIVLGSMTGGQGLSGQTIQSVTVEADQPSYNGACPARISFTATIRYSGSGNIQYSWLRSDGARTAAKSLSLAPGGTQTVTTSWQLNKDFQGWEALQISSPVSMESAHAAFSIACNGTKATGTAQSNTSNGTKAGSPLQSNASKAGLKGAQPVATAAGQGVARPLSNPGSGSLQIKDAQITVDKSSYKGSCPVSLRFSATVHSSGAGVIRYTWVTSDGGSNPVINKKLSGTGTDELAVHTWQLAKSFSGSVSIKIISPVAYSSPATAFHVDCLPAGAAAAGGTTAPVKAGTTTVRPASGATKVNPAQKPLKGGATAVPNTPAGGPAHN